MRPLDGNALGGNSYSHGRGAKCSASIHMQHFRQKSSMLAVLKTSTRLHTCRRGCKLSGTVCWGWASAQACRVHRRDEEPHTGRKQHPNPPKAALEQRLDPFMWCLLFMSGVTDACVNSYSKQVLIQRMQTCSVKASRMEKTKKTRTKNSGSWPHAAHAAVPKPCEWWAMGSKVCQSV